MNLNAFTQFFEGKVKYSASFQMSSKMLKMGITEESFFLKLKNEGEYFSDFEIFYKGGNYCVETNAGTIKRKSIYSSKKNKIFTIKENNDTITVTDASVDLETSMGHPPVITLLDTTVKVGERNCQIVRVKWKSGIYDYFFDKSYLNIDPKLYEGHEFDKWNEYLKISKALPVKIVKTVKGYMTVTMILIEATETKLDDSLFLIPEITNEEIPTMSPNQKEKKGR
jgi:hypothetical protein